MISPTIVDGVLEGLDDLLADSSFTFDMKDQFFHLIHELKYLKVYMLCLAKWYDSPFGKDKNFGFMEESHIQSALEEAARKCRMSKWNSSEFLEIIQHVKPKIKEDCLDFLDCPFQCEFSSDELPDFMMYISASLHSLLDLKAGMVLDVKVKIESLKDNLDLFKEVSEFSAKRCSSHEDLKDFKIHTQAWACCAACLSLLYWVLLLDAKKENMAPRMDVILSDLQKKISPSTPEVTRMYLAVLKASKPLAKDDGLTMGKLVLKFAEFVKDNLQVDPEKDGIQMLFIELIFLITFLMDPPRKAEKFAKGKLILAEADALVMNEVAPLISSLSSGEIKEGIAKERNFLLHTFLEKANTIKAEVRKLYAYLFPDPSSFNFPKINVLGFIDSLLENLKEFCFHFPKHQIMMLQEELLSLKESNLKDFSILELQNKYKDIKDLWRRIINVAYNAERAVSSFRYIKRSLWHDILCLSDVIEEVKLIKCEVKRIQDHHMDDILGLNSETSSNIPLQLQANIRAVDKVVVGFKDEVEEILGRLISGSKELDIISIIGMPGAGKTTLAKEVYSDATVRYHFNKCAWCTVSQTFNSKRILLQILSGLEVGDDNLSNMGEEDLVERVYRSLKGQTYLIVMDDIWDVSAWYALKMSFPEDKNGSRIMFTSRIHKLVSEAKSSCSPFPLNPLSEENSWELLRKKLFERGICPPNFVEIGKQIATNCKGLPLAVVLIAGLLKEKIENLDWWKQVGESLDRLIGTEGCTNILELSYEDLPELLKPCFLYFGLLQEDKEISVKKLILLWISEGFVQKHEIKSLEVVAKEYLMDLVARSLVIVSKRSSTGGIKACVVHDLLRDFCIAKGKEENVFEVIRVNEGLYMATTYVHYRVRVQTECWISFLEHAPPASPVHSLLLRPFSYGSRLSLHKYIQHLPFSHLKFLRVLHLDMNLGVYEFSEGITELFLLRFLEIACHSRHIPPSIKRLDKLETLILDNVGLMSFDLPLTLWEMQKLRHVYATTVQIPPDLSDDIPPLENVQTFSFPVLSYGDEKMFLRKIPKVRKLKCRFRLLGARKIRHQIVKLDFLSHLDSLFISHGDHTHLRSCAFYFPSTLKKLNLMDFRVPWRDISPITKLPNLEVLKLFDGFCGKTWNVGDDEFLKLKCLVLKMLDIKQFNASDDSFPCLERLEVDYCRNLKEIPPRFGSISTLERIRVNNCRSTLKSSVMQIQEDQIDLGNEHLEVLISGEITEHPSNLDSDSDSLDDFRDWKMRTRKSPDRKQEKKVYHIHQKSRGKYYLSE